jgi:hypothetical protein
LEESCSLGKRFLKSPPLHLSKSARNPGTRRLSAQEEKASSPKANNKTVLTANYKLNIKNIREFPVSDFNDILLHLEVS